MGVFNKLVNILFDEPEEIPVITKETKREQKVENHEKVKSEPKQENRVDDVIVTKIEKKPVDEDLFEMPKFNEDAKTDGIKKSSFTFPLIDDDEFEVKEDEKRSSRKSSREEKKSSRRHDYLSAFESRKKHEVENKPSNNISIYDSNSKKPFTLSPIISPVYGVLNENYKKEDISFRDSSGNRTSNSKVDFESVRRKAYGTLEDEIESSLKKNEKDDILEEVSTPNSFSLDNLSDDGLSIDDLLVDKKTIGDMEDEVFDIENEVIQNEIDIDEEEVIPEKTNSEVKDETPLEDDLFDLIDSIYAGKEEE